METSSIIIGEYSNYPSYKTGTGNDNGHGNNGLISLCIRVSATSRSTSMSALTKNAMSTDTDPNQRDGGLEENSQLDNEQYIREEDVGRPFGGDFSTILGTVSEERAHIEHDRGIKEQTRDTSDKSITTAPKSNETAVDSPAVQSQGISYTPYGHGHSVDREEPNQSQAFHDAQPGPKPGEDSSSETVVTDDSVLEEDIDSFSDYESEGSASFYSSLLSYATDYYWENGRRYHAHQEGRYLLPNDETELDREDMKHHEWMLITDFRHHLSPIGPNPQKILDIGTGTGIWAMQVAELYPSATVIGTDISPIQPKWVPPNLSFEVDDLEEEWLYKHNSYDFINLRFMSFAIKNWPAMLAQAYRTLKPGGYIELSELATTPIAMNSDYPQPVVTFEWLNMLAGAMDRTGMDMRAAKKFKDYIIEAGFVDVVETLFEIPWGPWPKDRKKKAIGLWHITQLKQGLQGITMKAFSKVYGWTPEQIEVFLVSLRKEFDDKNHHLLDHAHVVYGRKP